MNHLENVRGTLQAFYTVAMNKSDFETCQLVEKALESLDAHEKELDAMLQGFLENRKEPNYRDQKK